MEFRSYRTRALYQQVKNLKGDNRNKELSEKR